VSRSINLELNRVATATSSLNEVDLRTLAGVASGTISLSNFYGKSSGPVVGITWGPSIISESDSGIAYTSTGAVYAACFLNGQIYTSTDRINWTKRVSPVDVRPIPSTNMPSPNSIAANGAGRFVVVGNRGLILTSTDSGVTWTNYSIVTTAAFLEVKWLFDRFIAVGTSGLAYSSTDGITWTELGLGTSLPLYGVARNGSLTGVIVGGSGAILYSQNAIIWTSTISGASGAFAGVARGTSFFLAINGTDRRMYKSTDGITWTVNTTAALNPINRIEFAAGVFVITSSNNGVYTTTDGITLTLRTNTNTHVNASRIMWDGTRFIRSGGGFQLLESTNGTTWTNPRGTNSSRIWQILGIANSPTVWIKVHYSSRGFGGLIQSSSTGTGNSWTTRVATTSGIGFFGVTYSGTTFVAVGTGGVVRRSTDGLTWTSPNSGTTSQLNAVAARTTSSMLMVGLSGIAFTSQDSGSTWTSQSSGTTTTLRSIAWGANTYVVVGDSGQIRTTPDGFTWTFRSSGTSNNFTRVKFVNNVFIAVGESGLVRTSTDGITWVTVSVGTTQRIQDVAFGNGRYLLLTTKFVTAGSVGYNAMVVIYSTDLSTWTSTDAFGIDTLETVLHWDGSKFITGGDYGSMSQSLPPRNAQI
jgi:hypothetical protein